jgi:hypothetical protein
VPKGGLLLLRPRVGPKSTLPVSLCHQKAFALARRKFVVLISATVRFMICCCWNAWIFSVFCFPITLALCIVTLPVSLPVAVFRACRYSDATQLGIVLWAPPMLHYQVGNFISDIQSIGHWRTWSWRSIVGRGRFTSMHASEAACRELYAPFVT